MILKLVYDKEIHVYELKPNEFLQHIILKVKDLFRKVPQKFVITYKSPEQLQLTFNNNHEFDMFINQMEGVVKIIKLYITETGHSSLTETKSEQKLEVQQKPQVDEEMTQKIECTKEIDEATSVFTNIHQLNEEITSLSQKSQQKINCPTLITEKQFQELEKPENSDGNDQKGNKREEREQPSEREINTSMGECSDPKDLRISSSSSNQGQKQNLKDKQTSVQIKNEDLQFYEVQQPIFEKCVKEKETSSKMSKMEPSQQEEQPIAKQHIEDDFLSHNVTCDICNVFPICGVRFMCVVCKNYNLCQKCEEKYEHEHPLLKLRYSFQTPLKVEVDIPNFRERPKLQENFKAEKINLTEMDEKQRRERVLSLSSEISELFDKDLQECLNFVKANEEYTNETLIQAFMERKNPSELTNLKVKNQQNQINIIGNILNKAKNIKKYLFNNQ